MGDFIRRVRDLDRRDWYILGGAVLMIGGLAWVHPGLAAAFIGYVIVDWA